MGKTDQTLRVVCNGKEILRASFRDITAIKYHMKPNKLWVSYSHAFSGGTEQLLLDVSPEHHGDWLTVKHCCYSLVKGPKRTCDAGTDEFFAEKTKELLKCHKKKTDPTPQSADRAMSKGIFMSQKKATPQKSGSKGSATKQPIFKETITMGSTPKAFTPAVPDRSQDSESRDSTPSKPPKNIGNIEEGDQPPDNTQGMNTSSISSGAEHKDKEQQDINGRVKHQAGITEEIYNGLFYAKISGENSNIPVRLNDLVARRRTKSQINGGKKDKLDVFDGPWRIVGFDTPSKTYGYNLRDGSSTEYLYPAFRFDYY
jgi:hypothetical protein